MVLVTCDPQEHVFTAWTAVREKLGGLVGLMTLMRTCTLCGLRQNSRGEVIE